MSFLASPLVAADDYPIVHEDFESYADSAAFRSVWTDPTIDRFDITTADPIEGTQSITPNTNIARAATTSITTRDNEIWSADFVASGSTVQAGVHIHTGDITSPFTDTIFARLEWDNQEITVFAFEGGSSQSNSSALSETIGTGTRYRVTAQNDSGNNEVHAWVDNVDTGTEVGHVVLAYDTGYSEGHPLLFSQNQQITSIDYLVQWESRATMTFPGATVHDDFESYADAADASPPWDTGVPDFTEIVTTSVPEGSQAMTSTATQTYATRPDLTTEDDEVWTIDVQFTDSSASTVGILAHVQDETNSGTVLDDTLRARLDLQNDILDVAVWENGSFQDNGTSATSESLSTGTRYRVEVEPTSSGDVNGRVRNVDTDTEIASHTLAYDPSWTTGIPGIYWQDSGLATADVLREESP